MVDPVRAHHIVLVPAHLSASGALSAAKRLVSELNELAEVQAYLTLPKVRERKSGILIRTKKTGKIRSAITFPRGISPRSLPGNYEVLHLHNCLPALPLLLLTLLGRLRGKRVVITVHGIMEVSNPRQSYGINGMTLFGWRILVQIPLRIALRMSSTVHVFSESDLPLLPKGCSPFVAPNGAENSSAPTAGDKEPNTFFFLGNHTPNKGVNVLLQSATYLSSPCSILIGGSRRGDINYEVVPQSDVHVKILGFLSEDEVERYFRRSLAFVYPTKGDTFPLVVLQAMAHGCCVIATDVGGIRSMLTTDCGILVPINDAAALADAMEWVIANPVKAMEMGARARDRASNFTWPGQAAIVAQRYKLITQPHAHYGSH